MKREFGLIGVLIIGLAVAHDGLFAQTDASIGTWRLNLVKSSYNPGPAPKSNTVTIEPSGDGVKVTAKGVDGEGKPTGVSYTTAYDGKDIPVSLTGSEDYDAISVKRLDARKVEGFRKKGGRVVQTYSRVVSKDGDTMTITTTGTNAAGQRVINVAVYDKVPRR
jgi:hypothetical protein